MSSKLHIITVPPTMLMKEFIMNYFLFEENYALFLPRIYNFAVKCSLRESAYSNDQSNL